MEPFKDSEGDVNYTSVFLLSKFVKERLDSEAIRSETLIDMRRDEGNTAKSGRRFLSVFVPVGKRYDLDVPSPQTS